jgi:uncharacterized protein (TIGR03083 family)
MEIAEHLDALHREGELLAAAADRTGLDTPIPTCPEWRMRDLVRHMGDVHRWAGAHVAQRRRDPIRRAEEVAGPLPEDPELLDWFRRGHADLVRTLKTAPLDLDCWTFLPAPSPVAFWARRQAHETSIHRADAESPGGAPTPFPVSFAVDGIEELLFGFLGRPGDDDGTHPLRTLHLDATDADGEWLVRIGQAVVNVDRGHSDANCSVRGSASDLYLLLWNRRSADGLDVIGDASLLDLWRETVQIQWSRGR